MSYYLFSCNYLFRVRGFPFFGKRFVFHGRIFVHEVGDPMQIKNYNTESKALLMASFSVFQQEVCVELHSPLIVLI